MVVAFCARSCIMQSTHASLLFKPGLPTQRCLGSVRRLTSRPGRTCRLAFVAVARPSRPVPPQTPQVAVPLQQPPTAPPPRTPLSWTFISAMLVISVAALQLSRQLFKEFVTEAPAATEPSRGAVGSRPGEQGQAAPSTAPAAGPVTAARVEAQPASTEAPPHAEQAAGVKAPAPIVGAAEAPTAAAEEAPAAEDVAVPEPLIPAAAAAAAAALDVPAAEPAVPAVAPVAAEAPTPVVEEQVVEEQGLAPEPIAATAALPAAGEASAEPLEQQQALTLEECVAAIDSTRQQVQSLDSALVKLQSQALPLLDPQAKLEAEGVITQLGPVQGQLLEKAGSEEALALEQQAAELQWELFGVMERYAVRDESYRTQYRYTLSRYCMQRQLLATLEARRAVLGRMREVEAAQAATAAAAAEAERLEKVRQEEEEARAAVAAAAAAAETERLEKERVAAAAEAERLEKERVAAAAEAERLEKERVAAAAAEAERLEKEREEMERAAAAAAAAAKAEQLEMERREEQQRAAAAAAAATEAQRLEEERQREDEQAAAAAAALASQLLRQRQDDEADEEQVRATAAAKLAASRQLAEERRREREAAAAAAAAPPAGSDSQLSGNGASLNGNGAVPQLRLVAAGISIPHPRKVETGGEDAFFVSMDGLGAVGVADGVGGWALEGIDPAQYPRELLAACEDGLAHHEDPLNVLLHAHERAHAPGSCTVCLAAMDGEGRLKLVSLGDCGAAVVRPGEGLVFKADVQEHQFNQPYQMSSPQFLPGANHPLESQLYEVEVQPGDVVVLGSDGLFDNLWDHDIQTMVSERLQDLPPAADPWTLEGLAQELASQLAEAAHTHSQDPTYRSPFAVERHERVVHPVVRSITRPAGGKPDDITAVVAVICK